ncbi:hypothetical protein AV530_016882 [Patagioenas fasciata monilis]|uniref:Uncharacterized protein n=1 Tax=Patagioenas fasciata monilis TaxID=372326 RepID=A0A1V4J4L2_PATFA|nr:hypothetical protein AV530_016882 [Patagioenas fasciata monilis]
MLLSWSVPVEDATSPLLRLEQLGLCLDSCSSRSCMTWVKNYLYLTKPCGNTARRFRSVYLLTKQTFRHLLSLRTVHSRGCVLKQTLRSALPLFLALASGLCPKPRQVRTDVCTEQPWQW